MRNLVSISGGRASGYDCARGRWVAVSRLVMEKRLDRRLRRDEIVHHVNCCPWIDQWSNLQLLPDLRTHGRIHAAISAAYRASGTREPSTRERYLQFEEWARTESGIETGPSGFAYLIVRRPITDLDAFITELAS